MPLTALLTHPIPDEPQYADVATQIKVALKPKPQKIAFGDAALDAALESQSALAIMNLEHDLAEAYSRVEELSAMNAALHAKIRNLNTDKERQLAEAAQRIASTQAGFDGLSAQMEDKLARAAAKVSELAAANAALTQKVRCSRGRCNPWAVR